MNTMKDLREEVATRMRTAMHGREIDMVEQIRPELPHMLGITPLNKVHDPNNEKFTLLDPRHHFWKNYESDISTKREASEKIQTAIYSLKEDELFEKTYPYGEEAEVVYVECEVPESNNSETILQTSCEKCDTTITTQPTLLQETGHYFISFSITCDECGFERQLRENLKRV